MKRISEVYEDLKSKGLIEQIEEIIENEVKRISSDGSEESIFKKLKMIEK